MKKLILFLLFTVFLGWNMQIKAQSFVPISVPLIYGITLDCDGGKDHYMLFQKDNNDNTSDFFLYKFDGINFYAIDNFKMSPRGSVYCMGYYNGDIYIGGAFTSVNKTLLTDGLIKYSLDTKSIYTSKDLLKGKIKSVILNTIKNWRGQLIIGGNFVIGGLGGFSSPLIVGSDTTWSTFDSSVYSNGNSCIPSNKVEDILIEDSNRFYFIGTISKINSLVINGIAFRDNDRWVSLDNGLPNNKSYGASYNGIVKKYGKIFVSYIDTIYKKPVLSYFDGKSWQILNEPSDFYYKILSHSCGLYVSSQGLTLKTGIVLYDSLLNYTDLLGPSMMVNKMLEYNGDVYLTGNFKVNSKYYYFGKLNCGLMNDIENEKPNSISIYPNPASSEIQILIPENSNSIIRIFNNYGQCIRTTMNYKNKDKILIDDFVPGIYFIQISDQNQTKVFKLIKE